MNSKEKQYSQTAVGKSHYAYVIQPDTGNATFSIPPTYKVDLELTPQDAQPDINKIMNLQNNLVDDKVKTRGVAEGAVKKAELPFTKLDNNNYLFKFKLKQNGIRKSDGKSFSQAPKIFDNKGQPWDMSQNIYSGSTMRVNYELVPYDSPNHGVGVSLRLKDVQISKVETGGTSPFGGSELPSTEKDFC